MQIHKSTRAGSQLERAAPSAATAAGPMQSVHFDCEEQFAGQRIVAEIFAIEKRFVARA